MIGDPHILSLVPPLSTSLGSTSGTISLTFDRSKIYQQITLSADATFVLNSGGNNINGCTIILDILSDGSHSALFPFFTFENLNNFQKTKRNLVFLNYINGVVLIKILNSSTNLNKNINLVFVGNSIGSEAYGTWHQSVSDLLQARVAALGFSITVSHQSTATPGWDIGNMRTNGSATDALYDNNKINIILSVCEPYNQYRPRTNTTTAQQGADLINLYCQERKAANSGWKIVLFLGFDDNFNDTSNTTYYPPRTGFKQLQTDTINILKNYILSSQNFYDSINSVDPIFDSTDISLSVDGVHPTTGGYINGNIINRASQAIIEALTGFPQPTPVISIPNYLDNTVTITFPGATNQVNTAGVITSPSGIAGYGNTGISTLKLPAGQDGWIGFKVKNTDQGAILGFKTSNSVGSFSTFLVGMWLNLGAIAHLNNGSYNGSVSNYSSNDFLRIKRTGSAFTIDKLTLVGTWTTIYTFAATSTADLFIASDVDLNAVMRYPQGFNIS